MRSESFTHVRGDVQGEGKAQYAEIGSSIESSGPLRLLVWIYFLLAVISPSTAEVILQAPGLMIFHSVDAHTEDDGVQGVILRDVTLEAVGLKSAALGLVLWIEVEDDPLTLVV